MPFIHKRVFGSDISSPIRETLENRQNQLDNPQAGDSVQYTYDHGTNLDLSSKVPWIRMWTAVRGYDVINCEESINSSRGTCPDALKHISEKYTSKNGLKRTAADIEGITYGKDYANNKLVIYEVGNNIYDDYKSTSFTGDSMDVFMPDDFLTSNEFFKPQAGIIDMQSTTQGNLGIVIETVINFTVYNYFDYSNIFSRYFLYPGAHIFIDFGWDTSSIYNQKEYFTPGDNTAGDYDQSSFKSFVKDIYSINEGEPIDGNENHDGLIAQNKGNLEVLHGYVVKYNSTTNSDGTFSCSITVISRNNALFGYEQRGRNKIQSLFDNDINKILIKKVSQHLINENLISSDDTKNQKFMERVEFISQVDGISGNTASFYEILLKKLNRDSKEISIGNVEVAIDGQKKDGEDIKKGKAISFKLIEDNGSGVYYQWSDDIPSVENGSFGDLNDRIYVKMGFLEDELLNNHLSVILKGHEDSTKSDDINSYENVLFDSTGQYATFDYNLFMLQLTTKHNTGLKFLYPNDVLSSNRFHNGEQIDISILKNDIRSVKIRDLWISMDLINKSFASKGSVRESLEKILYEISQASYGIMNLELTGAGGESIYAIDVNSPSIKGGKQLGNRYSSFDYSSTYDYSHDDNGSNIESESDIPYDFDKLFMFSPYSKKSLVKNINLNLSMPSNTMSTVLSINATSLDKQIYPTSREVITWLAIKDMHAKNLSIDDSKSGIKGYEWLPVLSDKLSDRISEQSLSEKLKSIIPPEKIKNSGWLNAFASFMFTGNFDAGNMTDYDKAYNNIIEVIKSGKEKLDNTNSSLDIVDDDGKRYAIANDITEFFAMKVRNNLVPDSTDARQNILLPYSISMELYGIAELLPGQVFRVDYLPEIYRDKVVFIIEKVTNNISSGTWTTQISGMMMLRADKAFTTGHRPMNVGVNWSSKYLAKLGYGYDQIKTFNENPDIEWWFVQPDFTFGEYDKSRTKSELDEVQENAQGGKIVKVKEMSFEEIEIEGMPELPTIDFSDIIED